MECSRIVLRRGFLRRRRVVGMLCAVLPFFLFGCPSVPTDPEPPDNGTPDPPGTVSASILGYTGTVLLNVSDPLVSVLYTITGTPDSVSGFYVRVVDSGSDSAEVGDRVIIAPNLPIVGDDLQFRFNPAQAGLGFFRVGLEFTADGEDHSTKNTGVISVGLSPSPTFIQPAAPSTEIDDGSSLVISFDSGVASAGIQWRLFYLSAGDPIAVPPDQLGTEIAVGVGPTGSVLMVTSILEPGEYELGLSVTDIGLSIDEAVATGQSGRIVTIPNADESGPKLIIVAP